MLRPPLPWFPLVHTARCSLPEPAHCPPLGQDGTPASKTFEHIACEMGAEEAEEVCVAISDRGEHACFYRHARQAEGVSRGAWRGRKGHYFVPFRFAIISLTVNTRWFATAFVRIAVSSAICSRLGWSTCCGTSQMPGTTARCLPRLRARCRRCRCAAAAPTPACWLASYPVCPVLLPVHVYPCSCHAVNWQTSLATPGVSPFC